MTKVNEANKKPSIKERALSLLGNEDFFGELRKALKRGGLVGEVRNALAIYVVAISSLLNLPLSVLIKGASSGGKNFLATRVLDLLPGKLRSEKSQALQKQPGTTGQTISAIRSSTSRNATTPRVQSIPCVC